MKTILLTNKHAQLYVEELEEMIESIKLSDEYEILPKDIELNFIDPSLIIGGVQALYAGILIIEFGYKKVKEMIDSKKENYIKDKKINDISTSSKENEYIVNIDGNNIEIVLKNSESAIEISIGKFNK